MQRPFGILIWPRIVTCWRSYSGVLRGSLKGITGQHPVCSRCCMILAGVTLKTAGGTLDWLCSTRLSLGMWPLFPDQIGLVAADNRTRANHRYIKIQGNRGIFDWAALLICCQNSQWLEPASCCCCRWAGESSCLRSSAGQICACRMPYNPPPPLAWYSTRRSADYSARQHRRQEIGL